MCALHAAPNLPHLPCAQVLPLSSLADAMKLHRVQNEIDINQLLQHPHVVTFLGSFQDDQNVYLLQELCCEWPGWGGRVG